MRDVFVGALILALAALTPRSAVMAKPFDAAAAFGARPSTLNVSLSPDGANIAFLSPNKGSGAILYTLSLEKGAKPRVALVADGKPVRMRSCGWVSNARLVCNLYGIAADTPLGLLPFTRVVAVDYDGKNLKLLSTQNTEYQRGIKLGGGRVIDLSPSENGAVLMTRVYLPDDHTGSHIGSTREGLGVDRIDTQSLATVTVEPPKPEATEYLTDGHGSVRIMGTSDANARSQETGVYIFMYRTKASREWHRLSEYNSVDRSGFLPLAIDFAKDLVYGWKKLDGRMALYSVSLDGTLTETLVYQRPDVDVGNLVLVGREHRPVGINYTEEKGFTEYFDAEVKGIHDTVSRTLKLGNDIFDSSSDGSKLLIFAANDTTPGTFYLFDRKARQLQILLAVREELFDVPLAAVKPIRYPAADGTSIPGYLTLPPGEKEPKGLPAIVLPHGGPEYRDSWGFDWLPQFFAARGFVVIQPNFRGSSGYGDAWFVKNGFKSWNVAIGDVLDAGRWLVETGVADPQKLAIVGWSYGGYAALQSAVVDPKLFKAVVAIAPVTDLEALKEEHRNWADFDLVSRYVGDGPHLHEGSPIEHTDKIKVPVLLFHGAQDLNVGILESKRMASRLTSVGARCELVTWENLDHQLDDAEARTRLLRKSDEFLRQALGM